MTIADAAVAQHSALIPEELSSAWSEATRFEIPRDIVVRYHELRYPELTDDALAAMTERVRGKPDHPERRVLSAETRRRTAGPDRADYELWYKGPGAWRFNSTEHADRFFVDVAVTPSIAWALVPRTLTILDPRDPPPPGRDYASKEESSFGIVLRRFAWGGMGTPKALDLVPASGVVSSTGWELVAHAAACCTWKYSGRLSEDADRVIPELAHLLQDEHSPEFQGTTWSFVDWSFDGTMKQWIARKIEERAPTGLLVRVTVLDSIGPLDDSTFGDAVRLPEASGQDVARGPSTFKTILDFRSEVERVTSVGPDEMVDSPLPPSMLGHARSSVLRTLGWVCAAVLFAMLIGLRVHRLRTKSQ